MPHKLLLLLWFCCKRFTAVDLVKAILSDADLMLANFSRADLTKTNFQGAKRILLQQVKRAKNWQKANYDLEIREQLGLYGKSDEG